MKETMKEIRFNYKCIRPERDALTIVSENLSLKCSFGVALKKRAMKGGVLK